jgi:serine/threonine protein kinase
MRSPGTATMRTDALASIGIAVGDVLVGKYRIDRVLGAGGMGVVVAAHHLSFEKDIAIKFLLPEGLRNPELVSRFLREAKAAVRIESEHIVRVMDAGTLDNGAPYMVMEYLEGKDLSAVLADDGPLSVQDAVDYILQTCEAVAEAHVLGIVHRDLKPANLFLCRRPGRSAVVKVLDFGISKTAPRAGSSPDHAVTDTHAMLGSPLYMSPEHMMSTKDADHRTDIWSLGVILYELLTGDTPFVGETLAKLAVVVLQQPAPSLCAVRSEVPLGLEAIVKRCLEKDRGRRYQNVGELAAALGEFAPRRARVSIERISQAMSAAGMGSTAALPPSSAEAAIPKAVHKDAASTKHQTTSGATTDSSWAKTGRITRTGRKGVAFATLGIGLLVGGGLAVRQLIRSDAPVEPSAPSTVSSEAIGNAPAALAATVSATPPASQPNPAASAPTSDSTEVPAVRLAPEVQSASPAATASLVRREVSSSRPPKGSATKVTPTTARTPAPTPVAPAPAVPAAPKATEDRGANPF